MPDDKTNLTSVPRVQTDLPQVGIWIFNDGAQILEFLFRSDGCMRHYAVALISARSSNACAAISPARPLPTNGSSAPPCRPSRAAAQEPLGRRHHPYRDVTAGA